MAHPQVRARTAPPTACPHRRISSEWGKKRCGSGETGRRKRLGSVRCPTMRVRVPSPAPTLISVLTPASNHTVRQKWIAITQPFALRLTDGACCALTVINLPIVPTEIKLGNVTVKMLPADVVKRAHDAALEQRERRFNGVAMRAVRLCVLAARMIRSCRAWRIAARLDCCGRSSRCQSSNEIRA